MLLVILEDSTLLNETYLFYIFFVSVSAKPVGPCSHRRPTAFTSMAETVMNFFSER